MAIVRLPSCFVWKAGPSIIRRSNGCGGKRVYNCPIVIRSGNGCFTRTVQSSAQGPNADIGQLGIADISNCIF